MGYGRLDRGDSGTFRNFDRELSPILQDTQVADEKIKEGFRQKFTGFLTGIYAKRG